VAALNAAYDKGALPWDVLEAQLCERFRKFPEELDRVDVGRLMRDLRMLDVYQAAERQAKGEKLSDNESALMGQVLQMELDGN
jgi:hypothetical protein